MDNRFKLVTRKRTWGIPLLFSAAIASHAQTFTTLVNFTSAVGSPSQNAPLVQGTDGNFYGTTDSNGAHNTGSVFKMTPGGTLTTLYGFGSTSTDGEVPYGGLVQATDGSFYGTTNEGGAYFGGTVFKITPGGTLTTLYSFGSTSNSYGNPYGGLVQATDGSFYGTTYSGGASDQGTVFRITAGGTLTILHSFLGTDDGAAPSSGLVQATDGNFYGTTSAGGVDGYGTVFKITAGGTLTTLHSFGSASTDGANPEVALVQATDGNFYGTTSDLHFGHGTVFKITPGGALTTLHTFNLTDGSGPSGLIQASDGNFYGTTGSGVGTVFKITPGGTLTTQHTFSVTDGRSPQGPLVQAADGNFYGTTGSGGASGYGTVFSLTLPASNIPAPSILSGGVVPVYSSSSTIQPGEWVSIYGTNLASAAATWTGNFPTSLGGTSVTINGKSAYLWLVSPGQINLQAPSDTATGTVPVVVTTFAGSATSTVTLAQFAPTFLLLDAKHVTGIILRSNGSGAYGGGAYDIIGPTGKSLGYPTVAAKAGDTIELYGTGFGPTNPAVSAGQAYSGAAATTNPVILLVNNVSVTPAFAGLSGAGLYQLNLAVPPGLGTGDVSLQATVGGCTDAFWHCHLLTIVGPGDRSRQKVSGNGGFARPERAREAEPALPETGHYTNEEHATADPHPAR